MLRIRSAYGWLTSVRRACGYVQTAIDRCKLGVPLFGRLRSCPDVFYGFGYSGRGIIRTYLGGSILAALVREVDDEWSRCPLVRTPGRELPPMSFPSHDCL